MRNHISPTEKAFFNFATVYTFSLLTLTQESSLRREIYERTQTFRKEERIRIVSGRSMRNDRNDTKEVEMRKVEKRQRHRHYEFRVFYPVTCILDAFHL